jgi:hypothetical protein
VLREAPGLLFREDDLAVAEHVELPLGARDVSRRNTLVVQLGRETRGPLVIAHSGRAVVDLDGHAAEPTLSRSEE